MFLGVHVLIGKTARLPQLQGSVKIRVGDLVDVAFCDIMGLGVSWAGES